MRTVTIELPEAYEITSAKDAPSEYRTVKTASWTAEIILNAVEFGLSESIGNTWSVSKKDVETLKARHEAIERGDWARKGAKSSISDAKLAERVAKIDIAKLLAMLSPEQHKAILAAGGDISVVTTKQS
jgi:hypothetical protein